MTDHSSNTDLQEAFFNDGYRIAGNHLAADRAPASLHRAVEVMYEALDAFLFLYVKNAGASGTPSECRKGCSWCCHQAVFAETHTASYLTGWIRSHLLASEQEKVLEAARNKLQYAQSLNRQDRLVFKYPCPLLRDGACIAYEARPVSCRIYLSSDVDSCKYEFEHPEDSSRYPRLFALPLQLGRKMNEGFSSWLEENGTEVREFPLEEVIDSGIPETRD